MLTPIMQAAYCNPNPEVVRTLIEAGAKVNVLTGYHGRNEISPLGWALHRPPMKSQEETEATKTTQSNGKGLLLSAGNNQNEVFAGIDPRTAVAKIIDAITAFIDAEADINAINEDGETPLHYASQASNPNIEVITVLVNRGADINMQDNEGKTPLIYVVQGKNAKPEVVTFLLDKGADVNIKDKSRKRAVDYARTNSKLAVSVLRRLVKESRQ